MRVNRLPSSRAAGGDARPEIVSGTTAPAAAGASPVSRREAVGLLAAGFALAVQPVSAETITTDTDGLVAGEVRIPGPGGAFPVEGGEIPAYRAAPAQGGPFPIVIVVQEIFGVHEHIKDVCRRLAKLGYLAVAPELYLRQGKVAGMEDIQQIIRTVVAKVPDRQVMADLDATAAWAAAAGNGDPARLAVTGFCWGGRIVWLYAATNPAVKAGVAWYGRLVGDKDELHPLQPVDVAGMLKAPVLGLYGGADTGIPVDSVERMKGLLATGGGASEIVLYPDVPHGFHADYRPTYRPAEAADGWRRLLAWLKRHGVG